jgi:hypothetical protein
MSAAAAIARAEAAGLRLYLGPDGQVKMQAAAPPPPDVLADLRRWRDDVTHLLAARAAVADPPAEAPAAPAPAHAPPPGPDAWLGSIARSIRAALADGAVRAADEDGWLVLVRPDGRRTVVAPDALAQITAAGLLPDLPAPVVVEPGADDPVDRAERAAIQAEPALPPAGSPERAATDRQQADEIAGLLAAALSRPPGWSDVRSVPPPGAWCSCCGTHHRSGGHWWREAKARTGWRCRTCHPPVHRAPGEVVSVRTGMHPVGAPEDRP